MTKETTKRQVEELYPESDAATKRDLEGLANAISQFRAAVSHISAKAETVPVAVQMERARQRRRWAQRRVMLEWAFAAVAMIAMLLPGAGYYRHHAEMARERQEQALQQREADTALLDQVDSELSETVPDAMRPLADMESAYASDESSKLQGEKKNGEN
ncbi:MAG TPA: hypothetical protein VHT24_07820 [Pseudacidobacterium sp.]|jgi:hypothetical protein|nr:hypothetical protein [Pseudacidobacterium sp.]